MSNSTIKNKIEVLRNVEIFKDFTDYVLKSIADVLEEVEVKKGDNIVTKGEEGRCMYILFEGKAKIHDDEVKIADVEAVSIIGEMALLTSEPRNATITVTENAKLLLLNQNAFELISEDNVDFYKSIVKILIKKLQTQNNELIEFSRNARKILASV
ncbi:MAG: cyclic nucleotide-binding domain-containing protein [Cytophagales bacterium]